MTLQKYNTEKKNRTIRMDVKTQAAVYDFIKGNINGKQLAEAAGTTTAYASRIVGRCVMFWLERGLLRFTKEINNLKDLE